jgi:hypothetical protein
MIRTEAKTFILTPIKGSLMCQKHYSEHEGWPSSRQELLLKIALLGDPSMACEMWEKDRAWLIPGDVDVGSRFILPLVYRNLMGCHSRISPVELDYFRKLYLRTHAENTRHLLFMETLSERFNDAGLQLTLLKGSAMVLLYYKKAGLRPMSDLDVFIPFEKKDIALGILKSMGCKPKSGRPKHLFQSYFKWLHGYEFYSPDGQWIDLHWHILPECCRQETDDELRSGAVDFVHNGVHYSALNPSDQLLHAFVQGARCEGFAYLRWAADAATIIQHPGVDINWHRLIRLAKKYRLILPVRDGLNYLKDRIGIPVPGYVLQELNNLPVTRIEQYEYHYKRQRIDNRLFSYWPLLWFDYSRQVHDQTFVQKVIGFPGFLKDYWGIENITVFAELFRTMIGKMLGNLSRQRS